MENILEKITGSNLENHIGLIWLIAAGIYLFIVYLRLKCRRYRAFMVQTGENLELEIRKMTSWIEGLLVADGFVLFVGILSLLPPDSDRYLTAESAGVTFLLLTAVSVVIILICSGILFLLLEAGKCFIEKIKKS